MGAGRLPRGRPRDADAVSGNAQAPDQPVVIGKAWRYAIFGYYDNVTVATHYPSSLNFSSN